MSLSINTNLTSLNVQRSSARSQNDLSTAIARLSSGLRINSAKDDAAGLAVVSRFTAQIRGSTQAVRNTNDGISLAQTAQGGLASQSTLLQRMRELAVQSANGSNSSTDRASLQQEVAQLADEVDRIARSTQFNGQNLLDGSLTNAAFQVGADAHQTISTGIDTARAGAIGLSSLQGWNNALSGTRITPLTATWRSNSITAQTIAISTASTSNTYAVNAGDSISTIAAAINAQSGTTGVTASGATLCYMGGWGGIVAPGDLTFQLAGKNSNASAVTINATVTSTDMSQLVAAVNAQTGITGISAAVSDFPITGGTGIMLSNSDGSDIRIADFANLTTPGAYAYVSSIGTSVPQIKAIGTSAAADSITIGGAMSLSGPNSFSVSNNGAGPFGLIFAQTPAPISSTLASVAAIDIGTPAGASGAIATLDAALQSIDKSRASLGAIENRFSSTIDALQASSDNLSAARSRVEDADYATETAALARGQILQDAGSAVLAQANALPRNVLALLKS